jgi:flagellar assembly factor FliW
MRLTLPLGLVGLPDQTQFTLRSDASSGLVELVAREPGGLDFVAAPIERIRPGLRDRLVAMGDAGAGDLVLVLLAVHGEPAVLTANLAGPIVVDPGGGTGRQLVLEGDEFPLRAEIAKLA